MILTIVIFMRHHPHNWNTWNQNFTIAGGWKCNKSSI